MLSGGITRTPSHSLVVMRAAAAIFNSLGELLVLEEEGGGATFPQEVVDNDLPSACLDAAKRAVAQWSLAIGTHVLPIAVMPTDQATCQQGSVLRWVAFECCDVQGETEPARLRMDDPTLIPAMLAWRRPETITTAANCGEAAVAALHQWSATVLESRARAAASIDLAGVWARDASRNRGLVESLVQRGYTADSAAVLASQAYVQSWERSGEPGEWCVTTFAEDGVTPRRSLVYLLGEDWTEDFSSGSTLFGPGSDMLCRRTAWTARADADAAEADVEFELQTGLLSPSRAAHTTWTSRIGEAAEISSRFMRGGELVLERTHIVGPLRFSRRHARNRDATERPAFSVMSEETFVRAPEATAPAAVPHSSLVQ